jgi:predicted nucleic acid-binding Zn ribbon protein
MKQISDKDIINYLLSMYPEDNEGVKTETVDVEKDLSNIMTEHYNKDNKHRRRMPMFWMFLFVMIIILVLFLFMKRS